MSRGFCHIRVDGFNRCADYLRAYLHRGDFTIHGEGEKRFDVRIIIHEGCVLAIDSVDSPLEARILANLQELHPQPVLLKRAGGNQDPRSAVLDVPDADSAAVAQAVYRAILQVSDAPVPWTQWRWWLWAVLIAISLVANGTSLVAQAPVQIRQGSNIVQVTTTSGGSAQVECTAGCSTITSFPDNEPINVAQVGGSAVATGEGASGSGVPRVTVALDPVTYNGPTAVSVDGASEQVLAANTSRKFAIFTNTSSDTISCAVDATAVSNAGMVLPPFAVWTMLKDTLDTGAVNCISSGSASNLAVQEGQ